MDIEKIIFELGGLTKAVEGLKEKVHDGNKECVRQSKALWCKLEEDRKEKREALELVKKEHESKIRGLQDKQLISDARSGVIAAVVVVVISFGKTLFKFFKEMFI